MPIDRKETFKNKNEIIGVFIFSALLSIMFPEMTKVGLKRISAFK